MNVLRNRRQQWALWLALAAVFYRALIPAGFMPATAGQARTGAVLVLCSGSLFKADTAAPGRPGAHAYGECAFAAAAAPALPPASLPLPAGAAAAFLAVSPQAHDVAAAQLALPPPRGPPLA